MDDAREVRGPWFFCAVPWATGWEPTTSGTPWSYLTWSGQTCAWMMVFRLDSEDAA